MNVGFISMANTTFTQKSTSLAVETLFCQASKVDHRPSNNFQFNSKVKYHCFSVPEQNLGLRFQKDATKKMKMVVYASIPSGNSPPVSSSLGHWKAWIVGTVIIVLLSNTTNKWGPMLRLLLMKGKIGTTIDKAERVADEVEEVAERAEKVADVAVKNLPKGKLQDAAEFVENVAENVGKEAQNAEDLLEKVLTCVRTLF